MDELIARLRAVSETGCDPDLPHEAADAIVAMVRRAEDAEQLATARGHTIRSLQRELSAVKVERDALAAKLKELEGQEPFELNWPEYHHNGMGCGLEDRGITDRYEAMRHGWESALERVDEVLPEVFYTRPVPAEPVNARLVEALLKVARMAEDLKRPCGMDPESSQAIRNGLYMNISYVARAAIAAAEAQQTEPIDGRVIDRAWARFCGAFGDGPDAPYPGMIAAFETHYGQSFRDREWRTESACWAAAWHRATEHAAKQTEPVRLTGDQLEGLVKWYGEEPNIYLDRREYARTIQDEVLRANGYKVEG